MPRGGPGMGPLEFPLCPFQSHGVCLPSGLHPRAAHTWDSNGWFVFDWSVLESAGRWSRWVAGALTDAYSHGVPV